MKGRSTLVVAVTLLVSGALGSLYEQRQFNISPPTGSVITAFKYQQHIEIVCRITEGDEVRQTLWTMHTAQDLATGPSGGEDSDEGSSDEGSSSLYSGSPLMESEDSSEGEPPEITIDPNVDIRFSIEGQGGSVLVIDIFAPELNGSVIYCRDESMGDLVAFFTLMSTPVTIVTDPEPGPIFAEEFSNITILCDTQHENINQQHWVVQGQILPDGGNGPFVISGPQQNILTVVNFTQALDGTVIMCQIAFHGNIPIAQFSLHLRTDYPVVMPGVEYQNRKGECDLSNTLHIRQRLSGDVRSKIGQFAAQKRLDYL